MALLNAKGREVWSFVFPDGKVPIKGLMPFKAVLGMRGDGHKEADVYLVDWDALTAEQKALIVDHLKVRFNGKESDVKAQIEVHGLPLRASLVSSVAIPGRFF